MNTDLIKNAVACLKLQDVYLLNTTSSSAGILIAEDLEVQLKNGVAQVELLKNPADSSQDIVDFHIFSGMRFIQTEELLDPKAESDQDNKPVAEIEAVFVARYLVNPDAKVASEELQEFGQFNATYHVWPYWREFASSLSMRLRLPVVTLPMRPLLDQKGEG